MTSQTTKILNSKLPKRQNLDDPEELERRDEVRKLTTQEDLNDLRSVMASVEGRRFLWRQLQAYRVNENNADVSNTNNTFYLLGIRSSALWLENEMKRASIDNYLLTLNENLDVTT